MVDINAFLNQNTRSIDSPQMDGIKKTPLRTTAIQETLLAEQLAVHSYKETYPTKLFTSKAPNETDAQSKYRKGVYRPYTIAYFSKAMGTIRRIWNKQNYKVHFVDVDQADYFLENYPDYGNILSYFESYLTNWKIIDPNAIVAVVPLNLSKADDVKDTEYAEPYLHIYRCEDIVYLGSEATIAIYQHHSDRRPTIVHVWVKGEFRVYQRQRPGEDFVNTLVVPMALGYLPVWRLKGVPMMDGDDVYYRSYFADAVPLLDRALYNQSTLDLAVVGHAFPERWEIVDNCPAMGCNGGFVNSEHGLSTCQTCNGTGKANKGVLTTIQVSATNQMGEMVNPPLPPVGYVEKSTDILNYLDVSSTNDIAQAYAFLNIDVTNTEVKGSDTALGKQIDREELFSFLTIVSNELFHLLDECVEALGVVRYGSDWEGCDIAYPQNFSIRSNSDLIAELGEANQKQLPKRVIKMLTTELVDSRFGAVDDLSAYDDLYYHSGQDIAAGMALGVIPIEDAIRHTYLPLWWERLKDLDPKSIEAQLALLVENKVNAINRRGNDFNADSLLG